nr:guanylate kinase [uncultured Stomatobaculum sp.]
MRIFYLMGKSAAGKDTIYRKLLERFQTLRPLIPYTTRPQRAGEAEGREYHFVSEERFLELRESGRMIEERAYQTAKGFWRYGSVDEGGGEDTLWLGIGTLESYRKFCAYFGSERVIPLYLEVDAGERLKRSFAREQKEAAPCYAELVRRFQADEADYAEDKLLAAGIKKRYRNAELGACLGELYEDMLQYV